MRELKEIRRSLTSLQSLINDFQNDINLSMHKRKLSDLELETFNENFWNNQENSTKISQEISRLKKKIEPWESLSREVNDSSEYLDIAISENDLIVVEDIEKNIPLFTSTFEKLQTLELLSDADDFRNAYLTVHPGAGGTESQDWANMLLRMYLRYAEKNNFSVEIIDNVAGEEAGIKNATILVKGDYAFGFLKCEIGVHRLVRISPFDSNKRRHTSFASVEVLPEIDDTVEVEIIETDLRIDTFRSSGAGGQHVNTTDSAIRITHIPTGIVVQCQNERSQFKNKATAIKMLKAKLYEKKKKEMESIIEEKSGDKKDISWGNQIRSYVFQPYTLVKDHRTGEETGSVDYVLDGDIDNFIYSYLKELNKKRIHSK